VPGDLLRDGPAGRQACRHDRGRGDDLGRAEREVQVLRVLPGLAEDPLQDTAARDGVPSGQRVEQVEGVVVIPKLRVVWIPGLLLACAFASSAGGCSDYLRRVSGMAARMSSKAWRCWLVGSVRTGTVAGVPAKRSSLRVRVARWASSPWKLR